MSDAYMGTIQGFGFNFPPRGWANCNGALLAISQYTALYSLLGTIYGGDGRTNFALPDLRGRVALNMGTGPGLTRRNEGQRGGTETNTLNTGQMPAHNHQMPAHNHQLRATTATASVTSPSSTKLLGAPARGNDIYATPGALVTLENASGKQAITPLAAGPTSNTGSGTPVNNMQPYLVIEMCIALQGLYPSRN